MAVKKTLILYILEILENHSDAEHPLKQNNIEKYLNEEYSLPVDRKAVKRNLKNLLTTRDDIGYKKIERIAKDGTDASIYTDWYIEKEREFEDAELHLLIDSVLFSPHIPRAQGKQLIKKLASLSDDNFRTKIRHIETYTKSQPDNKQLFYTIDIIDEAITADKKVKLYYCQFGTDKKLHPCCDKSGNLKEYIVTPYKMAIKEGKFYLICNYDKYNDISNYRLDRIMDVTVLDEPGKPFKNLTGSAGGGLDLQKYMKEHIYMFTGSTVRAVFTIPRAMVGDVIDVFGEDVSFEETESNRIEVTAHVTDGAMRQYAKSFAPDVIVLKPQSLADEIKNDLVKAVGFYE